jgi:flagellar basal body-associated protein FliL
MNDTNENKSDTTVILAVLIVILIVAGILYLFFRYPQ